jgi:hypothetical protein
MILLSSIQPTNSHERKSVPSHYYCNGVYFLLFSNKKQQSGPNLPTSPALTCPPLGRSDGTDVAVFSMVGASRMTIGEPTLSVGFASPAGAAPPFGAHRTATLPTRRRERVAGSAEEDADAVAAASDGCSILPN